MDLSGNTAILFFTRAPHREAWVKRWTTDRKKNLEIARVLYHNARNQLESSGFPVFEISDAKQRGNSFGERFNNAFLDVFSRGYEQIIAVGSDNPGLDSIDWLEIASFVRNGKTVLGPDRRGGIYLLGISRQQFESVNLKDSPWQTPESYLETSFKSSLVLPQRLDLNTASDISVLIIESSDARVSLAIIAVIRNHHVTGSVEPRYQSVKIRRLKGRSPPVIVD